MVRFLALIALLGACTVDRVSESLECTTQDQCSGGRVCTDGYCLPRTCPSECTSCSNLEAAAPTCIIDCGTSACSIVTCPAGFACNVACDGDCRRVDCTLATTCSVTCSGGMACEDGVTCGTGACTVACSGNGACAAGVSCAGACSCDVTCGNNTCDTAATCPASTCTSGDGCSSASGGACNTCP